VSTIRGWTGSHDAPDADRLSLLHLYVSIAVLFIFAPLTWIRKIQKFKFGFIFGVGMILLTVVTIAIFCLI